MLKASCEVLNPTNGQSFLLRRFNKSAFDAPYHFHTEYELTTILEGKGKRFIGNHMTDYEEGDLILLGPKLPHCWKLNQDTHKQQVGSAIVVQFTNDFMGEGFFDKAEFVNIKNLLQNSSCGISFSSKTQQLIQQQLLKLAEQPNNFRIFIGLMDILQSLAVTTDYHLLDTQSTIAERSTSEQERINAVYAYLVEHFREQVSLEKVAAIAHMTPSAFCKYFKKITRKTFMETVIHYRLNYATQQLIQTDKSISEISFDSGFGDVSHFYKMFRSKMQLSPLHYRKKFMDNIHDD
ncbi:AraC family transcriptional regulator [Chitinophaga sp. MM2321]|uniref:AraC family transcriptional regulator n=1 Tax=Chitinophaga sp. MM2321 TaxID=3137178 RepID=UPI0032D5880D